MGLAAPVGAGPFEDAAAAFGDATAFRLMRPLVEQGDAEAQYNLGFMYEHGQGVPQDYAAARRWYRKAAGQGYAGAQYSLGGMYHFGEGVRRTMPRRRDGTARPPCRAAIRRTGTRRWRAGA